MTSESNNIEQLEYKPPYRFEQLLGFFRVRKLAGVEEIGEDYYARSVRIPLEDGKEATGWIRVENDAKSNALKLTISESLAPVAPEVAQRVRRQFDTESDPYIIQEAISTLDNVVPGAAVLGTRMPGAFDSFETVVRAILGQQVTLAVANKLAANIIQAHGKDIETPFQEVNHLSPTASKILALNPIEEEFGVLGVTRTRSRCIAEIARLVNCGELLLKPGVCIDEQKEQLCAIKGIGPWTANYVAMRVLGDTDAFLESDAGIKHALPNFSPKERAKLAKQWSPWRSYAVMNLWNSLA